MNILVGQKLGILEAQKLFDIIIEHCCPHFRLFAQLELVAMYVNNGKLKLFSGRILCCNDSENTWAYNVEENKEIKDKELKRIINLAFNEGVVRDYGN